MSSSYRQIFKSTSIIGGGAVIGGLLHLAQNKIIAVLLGTSGMALFGTFSSLAGMISNLTGFGLGSSAVRFIAEADGKRDRKAIAEIIFSYRRAVWGTGLLGMAVLAGGAWFFSLLTFKTSGYMWMIVALSPWVLLTAIYSGQCALLQGLHRIVGLSALRIWGVFVALLVSGPCFWLMREQGIVPCLVLTAAILAGGAWLLVRRVELEPVPRPAWKRQLEILKPMFRLGIAFMVINLIGGVCAYAQNAILIRNIGQEGCGLYLAGYALAGIFVNFVLNAMGTDYYPKLVNLLIDRPALNRAINEQMDISLLLVLPGVLVSLVFAPLIIRLLYSDAFVPAVILMRLFCFGILIRVFAWSLAYVLMAQGEGKILMSAEAVSGACGLVFFCVGLHLGGLNGAAISFMLNYCCYSLLLVGILHFRYRLHVAPGIWGGFGAALGILAAVFIFVEWASNWWILWGGGCFFCMVLSFGCARLLLRKLQITPEKLLQKVLHARK